MNILHTLLLSPQCLRKTSFPLVANVLLASYILLFLPASAVACSNPTTDFPLAEQFNNSLTDWTQSTSDDFDWTFRDGSTPSSGTGPSAAREGSHFLYTEASGSNHPQKSAILESPCMAFDIGATSSVGFYYHMFGTNMGQLYLELTSDDGQSWTTVWSQTGDQGDQWYRQVVDLSSYGGSTVKLRFRAVTGVGTSGWQSDMAIDDLRIVSEVVDDLSCDEGKDVNLYYMGLETVPATLEITEADGLESVRVEIVYKGGHPGNTITITDDQGNSYTASRVSVGSQSASVYSFDLPPVAAVTYTNVLNRDRAQSIVAYGIRSGQEGKQYVSKFTTLGSFSSTEYLNFVLPPRATVQDITLRVPISEVTYDDRRLDFTLSAGESSTFLSRSWGPNGFGFQNECCVDVVDIVLKDVAPDETELILEIVSPPNGQGQSYVIAGVLYVEVECFEDEICIDGIDNDNDGYIDCLDNDCGVIRNREFANGTSDWDLYVDPAHTADFSIDNTNKLSDAYSALVQNTGPVGDHWRVQLGQSGHDLVAGSTYVLSFEARASAATTITTGIELNQSPWTNYLWQSVDLLQIPQSYSFEFVATETVVANARLKFNIAGSNEEIWIDNVQLKEQCAEICGNGIDDDGDGLTDGLDPDCPVECFSDCDEPYQFRWFDGANGAQWPITNGESNLTRVYPVTGSLGTYNVSVTLTNDNGQNIDFSNCGTAGNHFYTATCNDPDAGADCDNDPFTNDGQFTYDCDYLTFGITSNNSDESVSITYDFEIPSNICDFQIGDIDYQGSGAGNLGSWQDEIDIVADSMGVPVQLTAEAGSAVNVNGNATNNLNLLSDYDATSGGNIDQNDPNGHAFVTTLGKVTSITFTYSNGPHDDGQSDDHAIRLSGFEFCPSSDAFCDIGIDEGGSIAADQQICDGSAPATLTSTSAASGNAPNGIAYQWYSSTSTCSIAQGITGDWHQIAGATGATYSPGVITTNTCYVRAAKDATCENYSGFSNVVSITLQTCCNNFSASIDYNGSVCLTASSQLTAVPTGGAGGNQYDWTGPNGFTGSTQTVSITDNGNYFLTVTDYTGCEATTSGFVYQQYDPTITSLQTDVCEGESVSLSVNSSTASAYQWSANAGGGTGASVSVTPSVPSSTYYVTITSDQGCTAVASSTIAATEAPTTDAGANQTICLGTAVSVTATTPINGAAPYAFDWGAIGSGQSVTFVPSGSTTANTTNTYIVTVTDDNGCHATDAVDVEVYSNPTATASTTPETCGSGDGTITFTFANHPTRTSIGLSINGGTSYTQRADNSGSYTFTNLSAGDYQLYSVWDDNSCPFSLGDITVVDQGKPTVAITGPDQLCIGDLTTLSPSSGGTWASSDNSIATVDNNGVVTAIAEGTVSFVFTSDANGCESDPTGNIEVGDNSSVSLSGPDQTCLGENITITASAAGGSWSSTNTAVATISATGVVTPVSDGSTVIIYTINSDCIASPSKTIAVGIKPQVTITGDTDLCVGENSYLTPNTGGSWVSSNSTVASVSNSGIVTALSPGSATFTFTANGGCVSDPSGTVTVSASPTVAIDYNGSLCLTDDSELTGITTGGTAPFDYSWSGPNGFTGNASTIAITDNGSYYLTITDANGCAANTSGFVYQRYEPFIVNLQTTVCEGDDVDLTVNASNTQGYQWSANAGSSTGNSVTVVPTVPSSNYYVTVTSTLGCTSVANAEIDVDAAPAVSISGDTRICEGETTNLQPSSGGAWLSTNPSVAVVNSNGLVTAVGAGTANFIYTSSATGCSSLEDVIVTVDPRPTVGFTGDANVCIGELTTLSPNTGGEWQSSNTNVATVTSSGVITAVGPGSAIFTFTSSSTGCTANTQEQLVVNNTPIAVVPSAGDLCIGEELQALPSQFGTWISTDESVALISNSGQITTIGAGSAAFIYTSNSTGCSSAESAAITVLSGVPVAITGGSNICQGQTTTLSPSTGGTWQSDNPAVATVSNSGVVTSILPGTVRFQFTETSSGCKSVFTDPITVEALPVIIISGDDGICIDETTTLMPTTGGTWVSNNPAVATINQSGVVTGVAAGAATFTYTAAGSGCQATSTGVTVYDTPNIQLSGDSQVCVAGSTTLAPSSGGFWTSNNNSVATVSSNGIVTGISEGVAEFTFTETGTGCAGSGSISITVVETPQTTVTGSADICIDETTTLSPTTGGYWISNNPSVATISSSGVVQGIDQGVARFVFVSDSGCSSQPSDPVLVYGRPQITTTGPTLTCVGAITSVTPTTGGTWTSSDTGIATITNSGVITGIAPGVVRFTYTEDQSGCSSQESEPFTIVEVPVVSVIGDQTICIGQTTNLAPTVGGTWASSDPTVAVVDNNGLVIGLSEGSVAFTFTAFDTGCQSELTEEIAIQAGPSVTITGSDQICVGETSTLSPTSGGTWTSTNPAVATISNAGVVTAIAQGVARFSFTPTATGCTSGLSEPLTVDAPPTVSIAGNGNICLGGAGQLFPSVGGTWVSSDENIATVTNAGEINGVSPGTAYFTFTDAATGCSSDGSLAATVLAPQVASILGDALICMGGHTTLSPSTGGIWISSNPAIATVTNAGIVRGMAPGVVTFTFTDALTGCSVGSETDPVEVKSCYADDFNVTTVNAEINSSVATNDILPAGTVYSSYSLVTKPSASVAILTIAADGTYTFMADTPGKYVYDVNICMEPVMYGCSQSLLEITVLDNIYSFDNILPNLDIATTYTGATPTTPGSPVTISTTANDDCVSAAGCDLSGAVITIVDDGNDGTATVSGEDIIYTPDAGFVGVDTVTYEICVGANCSETVQIVTVADGTASNSVYAADDFIWTTAGIATSSNIMANDGDAEGDQISVVPSGTAAAPTEVLGGSYYLDMAGQLVFTPAAGFAGYTEVTYTVCDDNATQACTDATVHILVFDDLRLQVKVYLEGALIENGNARSTSNTPLMRADLKNNPLTGENHIPMMDPYTFNTSAILDFTPNFTHVGPGLLVENQVITDSAAVFALSGDDAIVDWVFLELRDKNDMVNTIATRSALLQRDGDVVDLDGVSAVSFNGVAADSFYVVVNHRLHLAAMSELVPAGSLIDFTDVNTEIFNFGTDLIQGFDFTGLSQNTTVKPGYRALWAGDFNCDGKIKFTNPEDDLNWLFFEVLLHEDNTSNQLNFNFGYGYHNGDFNMDGRVKYTNPEDDTNYLFFQVLLYNLNPDYFTNFSFFLEQVPGN